MSTTIKLPPEGWEYRMLAEGEILREDDEVKVAGSWGKTLFPGLPILPGPPTSSYRRKGGRQLGPNEKLQEGAEIWLVDGAWKAPTWGVGMHPSELVTGLARRRIATENATPCRDSSLADSVKQLELTVARLEKENEYLQKQYSSVLVERAKLEDQIKSVRDLLEG